MLTLVELGHVRSRLYRPYYAARLSILVAREIWVIYFELLEKRMSISEKKNERARYDIG